MKPLSRAKETLRLVDTPPDLLLEIGVEELPARFVPQALQDLARLAEDWLQGNNLLHKGIITIGTPRRLVLRVSLLSSWTEPKFMEALGPGLAQAKDAQGNWTPAAQGFSRSQGVPLDKLEIRKTDRGERLCAVKRIEGVLTELILPKLLPEIIQKIPFPKNMVWEDSRFAFARPLRWIMALYGKDVVKFEIAGVKSDCKTWGLRTNGTKPLPIPSPDKYLSVVKKGGVIVDPTERRGLIEKQIQEAARKAGGTVHLDDHQALLEEVTHLVEQPSAVLGTFDERYLSLPPEVLVTSMKKHQKYFPVLDKDGKLKSSFIGICNGLGKDMAAVREGYERVLSARLSDAHFFFEQDKKSGLEDRVMALQGIVFLSPLTIKDKVHRIEALIKDFGPNLAASAEVEDALRIARLCKCDLVTNMVGEFPELQGIMGRIYADQEKPVVAEGIEQHYWPLSAEGELPRSVPAALVSMADKLDSLAGNFLAGNIPTGSADPYGLRRASVGILRILMERRWSLDMEAVSRKAMEKFAKPAETPKAHSALLDFFKQRWANLMEAKGYRFDEVQAVAVAFDDPVDAEKRLEALHSIRSHPDFAPLSVAFKRAANILTQAKQKGFLSNGSTVTPDRLKEPAEQGLFEAFRSVEGEVVPFLEQARYPETLRGLVKLRAPVDKFFDTVMVMAPEPDLRDNRLALLAGIAALFRRVADFSLLQDVPTPSPGSGPKGPAVGGQPGDGATNSAK